MGDKLSTLSQVPRVRMRRRAPLKPFPRALPALGVGLACAACAGGAAASHPPFPDPGHMSRFAPQPTVVRCPKPPLVEPRLAQPTLPRGILVGAHPRQLLLCRYPLDQRRPVVRRPVRNRVLSARIASDLNSLPQIPRGVYNCPAINSASILILAKERGHPIEEVWVNLTGCRIVTNGKTRRWGLTGGASARQVFTLIEDLTGGRAKPE